MQSPGPNDGRQDDGCPNTGHLPGQPVLMFDAGSWQAPTSPGDHSNLKRRTFFKLLQSLGTAMSSRFVAFEGLGTCIWGWLNPNYSYSKAESTDASGLRSCELEILPRPPAGSPTNRSRNWGGSQKVSLPKSGLLLSVLDPPQTVSPFLLLGLRTSQIRSTSIITTEAHAHATVTVTLNPIPKP